MGFEIVELIHLLEYEIVGSIHLLEYEIVELIPTSEK